jgi:hypothetical protein
MVSTAPSPPPPPILRRRHPKLSLEIPTQVRVAAEAEFVGDLVEAPAPIPEQARGVPGPAARVVRDDRCAEVAAEFAGEIDLVAAARPGELA